APARARKRPAVFVPPLEDDDGGGRDHAAVLSARDLRFRARGPKSVRSGAASTAEFAHLAAVDRRWSKPVPARHRRTGPRRVFRHPLWLAHLARGRRTRRAVLRDARHPPRAHRRLWWSGGLTPAHCPP